MMQMPATSFVERKVRAAIGGPLNLHRASVSCSETAPKQEDQTKSSVQTASVVKGCEYIYL